MENAEENTALLREPLRPNGNLQEPRSVKDKKRFLDYLSDITCHLIPPPVTFAREEIQQLYELSGISSVAFDANNQDHLNLLRELYKICFPEKATIPQKFHDDELWTSIGFQNTKPETDFRGGGVLSLRFLINFCRSHPEIVTEVREINRGQVPFLFACVMISAVFRFKIFYHFGLIDGYIQRHDERKMCSRHALKQFLNLYPPLLDQFQGVCDYYTLRVFKYWKNEFSANGRLCILDFKAAEENVEELVKSRLEVLDAYPKQPPVRNVLNYLFGLEKPNELPRIEPLRKN